jgi:uncharacterized membrane protein YccC
MRASVPPPSHSIGSAFAPPYMAGGLNAYGSGVIPPRIHIPSGLGARFMDLWASRMSIARLRSAIDALRYPFRAAVAATLALAGVELLGLPSGFWAPLSALAVLQAQIGASLAASRNYLIASATGVVVGAAIVSMAGASLPAAGVGVFLIAALAMAMRLPPAGAAIAAGVVPVLVLSVSGSPWQYGVYRLLDIAIGLGAAILVSLLFWPSRAVVQLRQATSGAVNDAATLAVNALRRLTGGSPQPTTVDLEARAMQRLQTAQGLLPAARQEPLRAAAHDLLPFYVSLMERIVEHARTVGELAGSQMPLTAISAMTPQFNSVADALQRSGTALARAIDEGTAGHPLSDVQAALDSLRRALDALHSVDVSTLAQSDDLLRLYSLIIALDALGREMERFAQRIEQPEQTAVRGAW